VIYAPRNDQTINIINTSSNFDCIYNCGHCVFSFDRLQKGNFVPWYNPTSPVRFRNPKYHAMLKKTLSSNGSTRVIGRLHTTQSLTAASLVWPVANFRFWLETLNEDLRPWFDLRMFPVIISVMALNYEYHTFQYDFTTPISAEIITPSAAPSAFLVQTGSVFLNKCIWIKIFHRSCCLPNVKPKCPLNCWHKFENFELR